MIKTKPTMEDYKNAVNSLARDKSPMIFQNSSPKHAAIVLTAMISHSVKDFYIYDEAFDGDIADHNFDFKTAIKYHLKAGKNISVVLRDGAKRNSDIYTTISELQKKHPDSLHIRRASSQFTKAVVDLYGKDINFAVADGISLRVEVADTAEDIKKNDEVEETENIRTAMCSFNRPDLAKPLIEIFNQTFTTCSPVVLP